MEITRVASCPRRRSCNCVPTKPFHSRASPILTRLPFDQCPLVAAVA